MGRKPGTELSLKAAWKIAVPLHVAARRLQHADTRAKAKSALLLHLRGWSPLLDDPAYRQAVPDHVARLAFDSAKKQLALATFEELETLARLDRLVSIDILMNAGGLPAG